MEKQVTELYNEIKCTRLVKLQHAEGIDCKTQNKQIITAEMYASLNAFPKWEKKKSGFEETLKEQLKYANYCIQEIPRHCIHNTRTTAKCGQLIIPYPSFCQYQNKSHTTKCKQFYIISLIDYTCT